MKNLSLLLLCFTAILSSFAQDIKIKKDIVQINDVPVVKMVGKAGLFSGVKYSFLSFTGDTLFKMKDCYLEYNDPRNAPLSWYELTFKNKTICLKKELTFIRDKQVANFLFALQPVFVKDGAIDTSLLNQFEKKNSYTEFIKADTAANYGFERKQKQALDATTWTRKTQKSIVLKHLVSDRHNLQGFTNYTVYDIIQDSIFIGVIVEKSNFKSEGQNQGYTYNYYFMKRLSKPFEYNGKTHAFGLVAYTEDSSIQSLKKIYVKEKTGFQPASQSKTPLEDYVKHLVDTGCMK